MKKKLVILICTTMVFTSCSKKNQETVTPADTITMTEAPTSTVDSGATKAPEAAETPNATEEPKASDTTDVTETPKETDTPKPTEASSIATQAPEEEDNGEPSIDESFQEAAETMESDVIDYLINGQEDIPESSKLLWSEDFLNKVDIKLMYQEYIDDDGDSTDVEAFAEYLTECAPVADGWEELFKADVKAAYDQEISKIELIEDVMYQGYIMQDGKEVPFVAVNARTGYYHG